MRFVLSPFAMLAALAAAAFLTALPGRAEQPSGAVYVSTLPAGADVWIDGTYVGRAPVLAGALPTGRHLLTLTKTGWVVRETSVTIRAGTTVLASVELRGRGVRGRSPAEPAGAFVLRGVPRGANVLVDGLPVAGGAPIPLSAGLHRVALLTAGGRTTRSFSIYPETTTDIVLHAPAPVEARSAVIAPAADYLPRRSWALAGTKVVVRYRGHLVVARLGSGDVRFDGALVSYEGVPQSIGGKIYLPLELLERLRSLPEPAAARSK